MKIPNHKLKKVSRSLFEKDPQVAARELLGKYIVRKTGRNTIVARIVETEAYSGKNDKGCHIHKSGLSKKTAPLFGRVGLAYVYSIHVNRYCLNVVTHKKGEAGGSLIRACEPLTGIELIKKNKQNKASDDLHKLINGPAKLCTGLKIDMSFNSGDLLGDKLYITRGDNVDRKSVTATERINIPYAEEAIKFKWRYIIKDSPFLSVNK